MGAQEYAVMERRASDDLLRYLQEQFNLHVAQQRDDNKAIGERFDRLLDKAAEAVSFTLQNGDAVQRINDDLREEKKERARLAERLAELERARVSDRVSRRVVFAMVGGAATVLATLASLLVGATEMLWKLKGK